MKLLPILFLSLSLIPCNSCSNRESQEKITYLDSNKGFEYLDEDYRITNITSKVFDSLRSKFFGKYAKKEGLNYKDSLATMLYAKYDGGKNVNINYIFNSIIGTSETYSHYLLISKKEADELIKKLNLRFPSDLYHYFADTTKKSPLKTSYIEDLKRKCFDKTKDSSVFSFNDNKKLMLYAFKIDADKRLNQYLKEKGLLNHEHK